MGLLYGIYGGLEVLDGCLWGDLWGPMGLRSQTYGGLMGPRRLWGCSSPCSMEFMGASFDNLWGPNVLQCFIYRICMDLWDCNMAPMGEYQSMLNGVYGGTL